MWVPIHHALPPPPLDPVHESERETGEVGGGDNNNVPFILKHPVYILLLIQ